MATSVSPSLASGVLPAVFIPSELRTTVLDDGATNCLTERLKKKSYDATRVDNAATD